MTVPPPRNGAVNVEKNGSGYLVVRSAPHSDVARWSSSNDSAGGRSGEPPVTPHFPHIKDLQAQADAVTKELSAFTPVRLNLPLSK